MQFVGLVVRRGALIGLEQAKGLLVACLGAACMSLDWC